MADRENKTAQIETLIGLLLSGRELPADFLESLQAWLIEPDEDTADKDAVLENSFDRMARSVDSKEYALESWPKLAEKLGMDPGLTEQKLADAYREGATAAAHRAPEHPAPPISRKKPLQRRLIPYMAAVIICAAAVPAFLLIRQHGTETHDISFTPFTLTTATSETDTLRLPDGSRVFVWENTAISYTGDFAENRQITINGEAFFSVLHDERYPFIVVGKEVSATVVGTEFHMRAFDEENYAEVAVAGGSVMVASGGLSVTLRPNERATIDKINKTISVTAIGDGELLKARGANLLLEGVSLGRAFAMIGEYFGVVMEVSSDLPAISGIVLDLNYGATVEDALFLLQAVNPVFDYSIQDSLIYIAAR